MYFQTKSIHLVGNLFKRRHGRNRASHDLINNGSGSTFHRSCDLAELYENTTRAAREVAIVVLFKHTLGVDKICFRENQPSVEVVPLG